MVGVKRFRKTLCDVKKLVSVGFKLGKHQEPFTPKKIGC